MPTPQSQSNSLVVSVGVQTNVGKERTENQDRITRAATPFGDLFVVADGVGGHQGGSEAAQIVIDGFAKYLTTYGRLALPEALQEAVRAISADLLQRSAANQALRGMGSTVVLCVVRGDHATYAHAGDSRAYLVRDRKLTQLTRDHSVMEKLVSQGVLTPAQAREHPDASVLTRAIGQSSDVPLDIAEIALQSNDALLLCSDGLWGYAKHEEMEAVATSGNLSASGVATALLNLALEGGGGDNISVQFLRFQTPDGQAFSIGKRKQKMIAVAGLASVLAAGSVVMFTSNQNHKLDPTFKIPQETIPITVPKPPKNPVPQNQKPPTSASKEPAKTTVPSPGTSTPPTEKTGQSTIKLIIIQGKDGRIAADPWVDQLNTLSYLEIPSPQAGSDDCLSLEQPTATLFHTPDKAAIAGRVQKDLPAAVLHAAAPEKLRLCGNAEMIVVPAKSTIDRVTGKVQTGGKVVLKKAQDAGKEVQKLGSEIGDEVKKRTSPK